MKGLVFSLLGVGKCGVTYDEKEEGLVVLRVVVVSCMLSIISCDYCAIVPVFGQSFNQIKCPRKGTSPRLRSV